MSSDKMVGRKTSRYRRRRGYSRPWGGAPRRSKAADQERQSAKQEERAWLRRDVLEELDY